MEKTKPPNRFSDFWDLGSKPYAWDKEQEISEYYVVLGLNSLERKLFWL